MQNDKGWMLCVTKVTHNITKRVTKVTWHAYVSYFYWKLRYLTYI